MKKDCASDEPNRKVISQNGPKYDQAGRYHLIPAVPRQYPIGQGYATFPCEFQQQVSQAQLNAAHHRFGKCLSDPTVQSNQSHEQKSNRIPNSAHNDQHRWETHRQRQGRDGFKWLNGYWQTINESGGHVSQPDSDKGSSGFIPFSEMSASTSGSIPPKLASAPENSASVKRNLPASADYAEFFTIFLKLKISVRVVGWHPIISSPGAGLAES